MGSTGTEFTKKKSEAAYGKADAHKSQAGADPGKKGSFCSEVDARILFCRLLHAKDCSCRLVFRVLNMWGTA